MYNITLYIYVCLSITGLIFKEVDYLEEEKKILPLTGLNNNIAEISQEKFLVLVVVSF